MKFRVVPLTAIAMCCLVLPACSTMHAPHIWPFYKKPKPAPEAVHELSLVNADGSEASFPQYWKRNTLVIDLSGVSGAGNVAARLNEETVWPVRVAVRVRPGSVQQLEIQADERDVLPVTAEGVEPIDLQVAPSLYTPKTAAIYISWGPMAAAVEAPPTPEPTFVSPQTTLPPAPEGSASEIVKPAEAAPAQASPPPGS